MFNLFHCNFESGNIRQYITSFQGMIGVSGEKQRDFFLPGQSLNGGGLSPWIGSAMEGNAALKREGEGVF